jgi:hypothetical protein
MGDHSKEAHDRAEAAFKKQEQQRARISAEYEAEADLVRERTARLKSLRLAREAAQKIADANQKPAERAILVENHE